MMKKFLGLLSLYLSALFMDVAWTENTESTRSYTACSGIPYRARYRCYAAQSMQDEKGARSRGRILKEGLPPVFDYETNQPKQDNSSKVGYNADSAQDFEDIKGYAGAGSNPKQDMSVDGMEMFQSKNDTQPEIEKDWIVVWDERQVSVQEIRQVCESGLAGTNKTCQREFSTAVTGFSARLTLNELERVLSEHRMRIKYAERDQVFQAATVTQTTNVPWGLDRIDSRSGLSGSYQYVNTGEGVSIYVIDTGIRVTHEQFGYLNGSAGSRAQSGYDFIDDDRNADDCTGHGTHVAGMAAGVDFGVAKDSRVHSVRVLDCYGSGSTQAVVAGIDWTEANHIKPAVATISLSGPASVSLDEATAALVAAGVTVTVPAGNDGWNACYNSPAKEPTVITVGASDETNSGSRSTNYGSCVDLFAPGTDILSADYGSDTSTLTRSGTSMGSPYTAGVAALHLQSNPQAAPSEVKTAVLTSATTGVLSGIGAGSPNRLLYSMVHAMTSAPTFQTMPPTSAPTAPTSTPTSAPTAPTTAPTSAPTSPTAAPTSVPTSVTLSPTTTSPTEPGPVPGVVSAFASFAPEVISGLPHIYNYSDGVSGTCTQVTYSCINDIYVRSAGVSGYTGPLPYRQSISATETLAGDITYTTYKSIDSSHLWLAVFDSRTSAINSVKINGRGGLYYYAYRYGSASRGSLGASSVDSRYYGWYRKVATRSYVSINHLIIAQGPSWTQTASISYSSYYSRSIERHTLTKAGGGTGSRIYYLLWAGDTVGTGTRYGYSYSVEDFRRVMNAFLYAISKTTSPTSPTTTPTMAPTLQTTPPTAAPTSPTASPTTTSPTSETPFSCTEYMSLGHTTSGIFTISAKNGSGLPDRSVYCDMEEDGGGWMLLYSYHNEMNVAYRALNSTHLPTSPSTGFSHWHLGPALGYTSADDVADVRFYCSTSRHARVIHFKTSNQHVRHVAVHGSHGSANSPSHWNTGWTALSDHSGYLPAATISTGNLGAFASYPFQGNNVAWGVASPSAYCDDISLGGNLSHQVWVRISGPTQAPTSAPTFPTTTPTAAPTSPTSSPTSAPTSKSASPTTITPSSCAEYMNLGHVTSGLYTIRAKNSSGLPDRRVFCDMEEDGGGWMLLYSYHRNLTTNRTLFDTTLPTSPINGYSHWHLGPALGYTSADDVLDVRFYCSASNHDRVMHFKTSNRHIRGVAVSGSHGSGNAVAHWNTGWTALSNHSAYLPEATTSTSNTGAFHGYAFSGFNGGWGIYSSYAYCDAYAERSSHQVWVRLSGPTSAPTSAPTSPTAASTSSPTSPTVSPTVSPTSPTASPTFVAPTTCIEYMYLGHAISGIYQISAKKGSGLPDQSVYCDMVEDGGGWMLLYSYNRNYSSNRPVIGLTLPTSPTTGYSHWHLGPALGYTNADDVLDVRFYCSTSRHERVMHFKTSNRHVRGVAVSGSHGHLNSPSHWRTGWTSLSNHSAHLPADTISSSNTAAFESSPFQGTDVDWAIFSSFAHCDDVGNFGASSHQVWVRLPGPTRAPTLAPTSPTTAPTVAPTSPTTSPTTAPTSPTSSPTATTPETCAEYLYLGHTVSGVYTISAQAGSGLPDRSVYCDMEEDGGGWMLLYSYNLNITLDYRYTYLPLNDTELPTSPTTGFSHWHLGPALGYTSTDNVVEVRFFCSTTQHSRVVHFKTSNQHIRAVAVTGEHGNRNLPSHWNTGWTALSNHSAYLPAATTYVNNYGAFATYSSFGTNDANWGVDMMMTPSCDAYGAWGELVNTSHQVWVRLAGPTRSPTSAPTSPTTAPTAAPTSPTSSPTATPTSPTASPTTAAPTPTPPTTCAEYMFLGYTTSGVYTIRAKAGSGLPDRRVYCDMEEDGGGWMLLYSYNRNFTSSTPLNDTTLPTSPTIGYSHWHLGPALGYTSADDVTDVRFYCRTSLHSRVIHFKTSNPHVRLVAVTGSHGGGISPSNWNTGWTALSNHSAYLPADTTYASNYRAFEHRPFSGTHVEWSIHSSYMGCDGWGNSAERSNHQIWVRLPGPTRAPTSTPTSPTVSPTLTPTSPTSSPTSTPTLYDPMPSLVGSFTSYASIILGHLPSVYDFFGGINGTCIDDGGNDMYDCGNMIHVKAAGNNTYSTPLAFRQSTTSTATGAGDITYTTYKSAASGSHAWLAIFHSPTAEIESFMVDGYTGANGSGSVRWGSLGVSTVDSRYYGWYKKVYGTSDPSINHLIIAPGSDWTQAASSDTNSDLHTLTRRGRRAASRVIYLLWAGINGYSYSTDQFRTSMDAFLEATGSSSSSTPPTLMSTRGPTSQTSPPTAAPTAPTTSPTFDTPYSCAEYMDLGHIMSGVYTISAKAGSGLPDRSVYCDMEEDGGGWMLLYSYNRNLTTNRELDGSHLPTSLTTGYSHWHLGPALGYNSANDVLDVRFFCNASSHDRVIHFKTSNHHIRSVAVSGSHGDQNFVANWTSGWTVLSNHSSHLPAATSSVSNYGAFYSSPFSSYSGSWYIYNSYAECGRRGQSERSSHQVWVRLAGPTSAPTSPTSTPTASPTSLTASPTAAPTSPTVSPTSSPTSPTTVPTVITPASCAEYMHLGHAPTGVYTISAKPGSGLPDQTVYCDMEEDGGGWMLLYSYNRNTSTSFRPLDGLNLPTSPTDGYSHWHLGDALGYTNADNVLDVRFYCWTSVHSRVVHFKTSNQHIRQVAVTGSHGTGNFAANWTTGWTALSNHSANLPASATSSSNYGAFYDNPFYSANAYWSISSSFVSCDDFTWLGNSSHQVWVRLPVPPTLSPTVDSPTSSASGPTTKPKKSPGNKRKQPLKDNWFRKRDVARQNAFPQKYSWLRKQAKQENTNDAV